MHDVTLSFPSMYILRLYETELSMKTKVAMWGNSSAVRLPADLAAEAGLAKGTPVRLIKTDRGILIERTRPRPTLAELLRNTPVNASVPGWDENGAVGNELL